MGTLNYPPLADFALHMKLRCGLMHLVETGTYQGASTSWAAEHFERVDTVDIRQDFLEQARTACADAPNITWHIGDSRSILPKLVAETSGPTLFWLDAHNASHLFGDGPDDCPVLDELYSVLSSPHPHVVMIDDAHCFIPPVPHDAAVWPEIWQIKASARRWGYSVCVAHDVIAVVPAECEDDLTVLSGRTLAVPAPQPIRWRPSANLASFGQGGFKVRATMTQGADLPPVQEAPEAGAGGITEIVLTEYGRMLVPRYDTNQTAALQGGYALSRSDIQLLRDLLCERAGPRVFVDIGANVGSFGFGLQGCCERVLMFEPQRIIYNMLAGSIALNGWLNVFAYQMAVSDEDGHIPVPQFDYGKTCSFGSIEFGGDQVERLHQEPGNDPTRVEYVQTIKLDDFALQRIDCMKIDVEGMELQVLRGARGTIRDCQPVILIEHGKTGKVALERALADLGYSNITDVGGDLLALPPGVAP